MYALKERPIPLLVLNQTLCRVTSLTIVIYSACQGRSLRRRLVLSMQTSKHVLTSNSHRITVGYSKYEN